MKHVLFICTGNICRSPMAEGLFRAATAGRDDISVSSAGVSTSHGQQPSGDAILVLTEFGIDISHQRSQPVSADLIAAADFIFAMTSGHLMTLQRRFPQAAEKAFLVREFEDLDATTPFADIPDPIGMGVGVYAQCRDVVHAAIPSLIQFIDQSNENPSITTQESPVKPLKIAIGADHGGVEIKNHLVTHLNTVGYTVDDKGAFDSTSVDYPDFADAVVQEILAGDAGFGILVCKTGIGMSISANRHPQIRAAVVSDEATAKVTRQHNNSNVLCIGSGATSPAEAVKLVDAFLATEFEGGRHQRRLDKVGGCCGGGTSLASVDPEVASAIEDEEQRQAANIELIASENFTSRAVMAAQGSCLTNKYAEGYPGKRWYGGCENVDVVEQLAIDRAKELFGAEYANVQPHSGSQANMAVYFSVLKPGDKILTMDLAHGGHLTHGHRANFSGKLYEVSHYGVSQENEQIDYDALAKQAEEFKPRMITAGASAYPRAIDFKRMREIADSVDAYLFVDMAHIAGLVAGGQHASPVGIADFVTTTTHKSLRGPRGGLILAREELGKKIDSNTFPGIQGGPLMHVIAAKAVCLKEALQPEFKEYTQQIVLNAKALAAKLAANGFRIVSGGTDNHLLLVDLRAKNLNGRDAQETLDLAGITVNKNAIPFDTESIMKTGGIRVGTPAVTTRGMKEDDMMEIADLIDSALANIGNDGALAKIKQTVKEMNRKFPLPA